VRFFAGTKLPRYIHIRSGGKEMKPTGSISPARAATAVCLLLLVSFPLTVLAAPDAAQVAGDLKVDAIHFSTDGSVQSQACPWGYNGGNIGFLLGKVGIGTLTPSAELDVSGTVKATQFSGDGSGLTNVWKSAGNAGTVPGTNFIGTTDGTQVDFRVNNQIAYRLIYGSGFTQPGPGVDFIYEGSPNVLGGSGYNSIASGSIGATIGGGGARYAYSDTPYVIVSEPNTVNSHFGTVSGGKGNSADEKATVGGGENNSASALSFVGGGSGNTGSGIISAVGGGIHNTASGSYSSVGGGNANTASGSNSTVGGGDLNTASGSNSTVGGGASNTAGGDYSWAGGRYAKVRNATSAGNATGDQGTFLWSDSSASKYFSSITSNEFAVRATGGFRFVTAVDSTSGNPTQSTVISYNGNVGIGNTAPISPLTVTAGNVTSGALWAGTANVNGFEVGGTGSDRYVSMKRDGADKSVLHITKSDAGKLVSFFINGIERGKITFDGANTLYTSLSDARLKENIRPTAFGVDDLMKLEVKDYTFKADATGAVLTGFLAQDLYTVIPQAVTVGGDDPTTRPWQVDYGKLTPFLVKAVQDLKTRNDALQAENDALKQRLEKIEKTLFGQ
jgi:hypothetical protein